MQFLIKKWYFDGVSEDGRAIICYSAKLTWRGLTAEYVSYIYLRAPGNSSSESRLGDAPEPEIEGSVIRWKDAGLCLQGEWESAAPPLRAMLHESEEGYLEWHCLQPASKCRIQLDGEPAIEGWGYVECLEMTIPPWKMSFNELRWGRFAHPEAPIVWIDLKGSLNRCWVFDGETQVAVATVSDEIIQLPERKKNLLLNDPVVIEDKKKIIEVVHALVAWLPGFDRFTPLRFLKAQETKWRSTGRLTTTGHAERKGWVIHECVKF